MRQASCSLLSHRLRAAALAAPITVGLGLCAVASAASLPDSFAPLVDKLLPAVVTIATTQVQGGTSPRDVPRVPRMPPGSPFEELFRQFGVPQGQLQEPQKLTALGSGFIVDPAGIVVTNNHVVENGSDIKVTLQDGTVLPGKLVGHDQGSDLAVVKIEAGHPLPSVSFGDSDQTRVGDWVLAAGNPFGLGGTVTAGIVSARGRSIQAGPYDSFLQVDAPINRGNSGGPTFNLEGQVVGINTAIYTPNGGSVGIGFAIPANVARGIIAQLESSGHVTRGWLGVEIQPMTPEIAAALGLERDRGVLVAGVEPASPAAKAGIKVGDVITGFGGQPIKALPNLTLAVAQSKVGSDQRIDLIRQGKEMTLDVQIAELQQQEANAGAGGMSGRSGARSRSAARVASLGVTIAPLDEDLRRRLDLESDVHGVVITGVSPDSVAAGQGLRAGDIIEQVNTSPVERSEDVTAQVDAARQAGRGSIAVLVRRDDAERFVALPLQTRSGGAQ